MADIKENQLVIEDDEGNSHLVDILFTYENEQRGKKYVFFVSPNSEEEIICMSYDEQGELHDISDEEFEEAEEVLASFEENNNNQ